MADDALPGEMLLFTREQHRQNYLRDYRLIASSLGAESRAPRGREEEERRLAAGAVECLRESLFHTLTLVKRSVDAKTCILLWMAGGMAAPETFDPKRYTPFAVGVPAEKILCTFPAIDTVVDNIKISQGLEHVAKVLDRGTLIRSHIVADLGNILHSRHQYHWHTGYVPPQTVAVPHIGSWIARVRGPNNPAIPAFLNHL